MTGGRNKYLVSSLLLTTAAVWGGSFVIMKDTLQRENVNSFLAYRFFIATLLLIALKPTALKAISPKFLLKSIAIGVLLGSGYIFQSFGLTQTTVAKTGFITGLYAIFVPLIAAGLFKKVVTKIQWASVLLAFVGLLFLSFNGFSIGVGESLVLVSAILFAFHIIFLSEWSSGMDTYALTIIQMAVVGLLAFASTAKQGFQAPPDAKAWQAVIFTAIFASAFAFLVQTWTQSFMAATTVGILLTMEYIFAAIFGVLFAHEHMTPRILIGGSLVIIAMVVIIANENSTSTSTGERATRD